MQRCALLRFPIPSAGVEWGSHDTPGSTDGVIQL